MIFLIFIHRPKN